MTKAPADQFYYADFLRDTNELSLAATGGWMKCLCKMWFSVTRGQISMPLSGYARMFGCTVDQAKAVVEEIREYRIGDAVTEANGNITLTNRRMHRDAKEAEANRIRQSRYREKQKEAYGGECNAKVTTPSSSSPSYNTNTLDARAFDFPIRGLIEAFPDLNITPAQCGMIEAAVKPGDELAWSETLGIYAANHNRATGSYLPEKVGNLLSVFKAEKQKAAKNNNSGSYNKAAKPKDVPGREDFASASEPDPPCPYCGKEICWTDHRVDMHIQ